MWGADGRRWHFVSGSIALDFGYTGDYGHGRPDWERLHTPHDLRAWLEDRFGPTAPASADDFEHALTTRRAICSLAVSAADAQALPATSIDVVNGAAAVTPIRPHLTGGSTKPPVATVPGALSTIAADAVAVFASSGGRVRRCSAADCALIFYDHSRPNSRRWCSMTRCGNRAKVHRHRATRQGAAR